MSRKERFESWLEEFEDELAEGFQEAVEEEEVGPEDWDEWVDKMWRLRSEGRSGD